MEQFAFQGFSGSIVSMIDGADIYQTDTWGNKKLIGKTQAAFDELQATTQQYYDKLVELGVIIPPKTQEELIGEMQATMLEMSKIIAGLSGEVKELRDGHKQCNCDSKQDVSKRQSKRGSGESTTGDCGDIG
jgi:hypothetical protein